jgi:ABC-type branched-subunit amino acid transport system substrate-binding protein
MKSRILALKRQTLVALTVAAVALIGILAVGVGVVPASSGAAASEPPILIGEIAGTTGAYGSTGVAVVHGAQVAVAHLNANGGILGRKVELAWYDDNASATVSSEEFRRLITAGAVVIVGSPDTGPATVAESTRYKIPDVGIIDDGGPTIYTKGIDGPPSPWAWGFSINNYGMGQLSAEYALKHCPGGKFAILHDTTTYGLGLSQSAAQVYKAAGKQLSLNDSITENWSTGAVVDLTSEINKVKATGAKCVDVWLTPQDTAGFLQQANSLGDKFIVFGNDEVYATNTFVQLAGKLANGVISAEQATALKPNAVTDSFNKQFGAMFHPAKGYNTTYAQATYDAILIVAQAITKENSTGPSKIQYALNHTTNFPGATGVISFTPQQHQSMTAATMVLIQYNASTGTWNKLSM